MNRISSQSEQTAESVESDISFRAELAVQAATRHSFPYSVFMPLHYEKNYSYPLIIWLHANGHNERELTQIMQLVSIRNYVGVAPRGPVGAGGTSKFGFAWSDEESSIMTAEHRVYDCIEIAQQRFNVNPARVFLAGYEAGGTMAIRLALRNPACFAGAMSVGGPFPRGHMPLMQLDFARKLPLFLAHGREAYHYSVDQSCLDLRLIHSAGLSVTLRQYPCGDELTTTMLSDMDAWIMEQVTGIPMAEETTMLLPPEDAN
jgi:phospholipase/carboxylesterase